MMLLFVLNAFEGVACRWLLKLFDFLLLRFVSSSVEIPFCHLAQPERNTMFEIASA